MKNQLVSTVLFGLLFVISALFFFSCEKESISDTQTPTDTITNLKKNQKDCGGEFDASGAGANKGEAERALEKSAANACFNICLNQRCKKGACNFHKISYKITNREITDDGEFRLTAKVTCKCKCEDCKKTKNISHPDFIGQGESQADADMMAVMNAEEYCRNVVCPSYPCDDDEICQFDKAKYSGPEAIESPGGLKNAKVVLHECDCECDEPSDDPSN